MSYDEDKWVKRGMETLYQKGILKRTPVRSFLLWLVMDSKVKLGPFAPWIMGLVLWSWPRKVK